jgi:hypothetical protein
MANKNKERSIKSLMGLGNNYKLMIFFKVKENHILICLTLKIKSISNPQTTYAWNNKIKNTNTKKHRGALRPTNTL